MPGHSHPTQYRLSGALVTNSFTTKRSPRSGSGCAICHGRRARRPRQRHGQRGRCLSTGIPGRRAGVARRHQRPGWRAGGRRGGGAAQYVRPTAARCRQPAPAGAAAGPSGGAAADARPDGAGGGCNARRRLLVVPSRASQEAVVAARRRHSPPRSRRAQPTTRTPSARCSSRRDWRSTMRRSLRKGGTTRSL